MSPATTAPKTRSRMIRAAGSPNWSSPFSRSSCERRLKSWSSARSPAIETSKAGSSFAASSASITAGVSPSSRIAIETRVALRSSETAAVDGSVRYERGFSACSSASRMRAPANARNSGASTVYRSERMTTTSVVNVSGFGGNARAMASIARSDSGLFVGAPSVVRLSPRRAPIAAIARTEATIHAPIVRHGCRALAVVMVWSRASRTSPPSSFDGLTLLRVAGRARRRARRPTRHGSFAGSGARRASRRRARPRRPRAQGRSRR